MAETSSMRALSRSATSEMPSGSCHAPSHSTCGPFASVCQTRIAGHDDDRGEHGDADAALQARRPAEGERERGAEQRQEHGQRHEVGHGEVGRVHRRHGLPSPSASSSDVVVEASEGS